MLVRDKRASLDQFIPKDNWYRIEARESVKTIPELKAGNKVVWSQSVVRTGYFFSPVDMPIEETNKRALVSLDYDIVNLEKLIVDLSGHSYEAFSGQWHRDIFDYSKWYFPLRIIYRKIKNRWLDEVKREYKGEHPLNLRTFWYFHHKPVMGLITGIKSRQIGRYISGYVERHYDENDFEPAYLDVKTHQQVYVCEPHDAGQFNWEYSISVHPLDVTSA